MSSLSQQRKRVPSANPAPKKKNLTKPVWDSTNSDLNQLKSSQEELERRRAACQSKNIEVVKYEKQREAMLKSQKQEHSTSNKQLSSRSQLALLKEILYDNEQLKQLITKSDSTLKTVQDFFQEDDEMDRNATFMNQQKKQVKINMTCTPNVTDLNDSKLPCNPSTKKTFKQQKNVSRVNIFQANDVPDGEVTKQPENELEILDLKLKEAMLNEDFFRYHQLMAIKEEVTSKIASTLQLSKLQDKPKPKGKPDLSGLDECIKMLSKQSSVTPKSERPNGQNVNDTEKINRLKELIKTYAHSLDEPNEMLSGNPEEISETTQKQRSAASSSEFSDELKRALTELENKMYEFEKEAGQKNTAECLIFKSLLDGTFTSSSYSLSLIRIVSTMLDYQKNVVKELNHEKFKNSESMKQLDIHRKLIDGLTHEILCVKEQNEKLGTVYINQANHQAKIEAELDQMKIMIRATGLFHQQQQIYQHSKPPIIDAQPKQSSAFFHPSQTQLHKPLVQQQQQQHSAELHGLMRPMSCIDSINDYNRTNNYRYPLDDALNEVKSDRFIERLNAMLHQSNNTLHENSQLNSISCQNLAEKKVLANQHHDQTRSSSAFGLANFGKPMNKLSDLSNSSEISDPLQVSQSIATTRYSDFNSQIQELGARNARAQQKLKQLKSESNIQPKIQENLDKLKSEQQLLKDQINKLNRERECAQMELETLSLNSSELGVKTKVLDRANLLKNLENIEFNRIDLKNQNVTPNMSPIPNENIFHDGIETKSSANRFTLQSNEETNASGLINKNRE